MFDYLDIPKYGALAKLYLREPCSEFPKVKDGMKYLEFDYVITFLLYVHIKNTFFPVKSINFQMCKSGRYTTKAYKGGIP